MRKIMVLIAFCWILSACSPEVGSESWCKKLKEKPKGEWTANEVKDYAKNCILK